MKKSIAIYIILLLSFSIMAQSEDWSDRLQISNQSKINSAATDFAPSYWNDYIVYTSSKANNNSIDPNTQEAYFDLYFSGLNNNNEMEKSALLSREINSEFHEATAAFFNEGNEVYFSGLNENGYMNIFKSSYINGEWQDISRLEFNEDGCQTMHATTNNDGSQIIFSSDRKGGYGLLDLYIVNLENNVWSEPFNLGSNINSKGHDIFPHLCENNNIFFTTNGHSQSGDLDIYKTILSDTAESKIFKLPSPINSEHDDLSLITNTTGTNGYFSSNRPGGLGRDDIYYYKSEESLFSLGIKNYNIINVSIVDEKGEAVPHAKLRYRHVNEDALQVFDKALFELNRDSYDSTLVNKEGVANLDLKLYYTLIEAEAEGKEKFQIIVTNKLKNKELQLRLKDKEEVVVTPIENEIKTGINDKNLNVGTVLVFENIYYDYNSHEIKRGAALELDDLTNVMKDNKSIKVQLIAHTDSRGEDDYNLLLSEKRAISAKQYLVDKGVDPSRISTIGYGELRLRNHCKDGVICSDSEHVYNRRTEVKILEN